MKTIKDFINEAAVVKLDPSLTISLNAKTNEYTVNYTDKRGKKYSQVADDFEMKRFAETAMEVQLGTRTGMQKPWMDKLIKWVKKYPV